MDSALPRLRYLVGELRTRTATSGTVPERHSTTALARTYHLPRTIQRCTSAEAPSYELLVLALFVQKHALKHRSF